MNNLNALLSLPAPALVGLGLLVVVQLVLDVVALVDLYKRPVGQVAFGNKWIWVAIIVLINTIGAILYLVIGRKAPASAEVRPADPAATRAADAAQLLYGAPKDSGTR
jgi:hypothetical protein